MWGQEANPVTNKSEYITEGYALRKSLTGPRYKKQKKENWMFRKVYKKISEGAWKMYNFNCLCNLWIWFTTKTNKVKLIFYQPSKEVIVPWARSPQQCFLRYYPWLIWWICAADLGWWPFHPLEFWTLRVSVWAVKVDEEQSIVTFFVSPFSPQVFSMFLSLKANLILYAKWNESEL